MKKIITAINNPKLNEELKKENNFEIVCKDIQYREAILEILEKNKNIDLIIISEEILGEIKFEKLIEKIKQINEKIKIIFILEKENNYLEKILIKNNIKDIYYNNKINLKELIKIINKKEINMEEEIKKLKKIIEEKNINCEELKNNYIEEDNQQNKIENKTKTQKKNTKPIKKNNNKNFYQKQHKNKNKYLVDKKNYILKNILIKLTSKISKKQHVMLKKIITFSGNYKSGKTTLALTICHYLSRKKYKILLIDGDFEKQDLSIILKSKFKVNINKNNYPKTQSKSHKREFYNNQKRYDKPKRNIKNNTSILPKYGNKKEDIYNFKNKNYDLKKNKSIILKIKNYLYNSKFPKINRVTRNKPSITNFKKVKSKIFKSYIKNNLKKIKKELETNTKKISKNFYFFPSLKFLFEKNETENQEQIKRKINILFNIISRNFDFIIVDLAKNNYSNINKEILKKSHKNLVVMEGNILGIKEVQKLLTVYTKRWKINKNSLHIIENKINIISINRRITSKILYVQNKIQKIRENKKFVLLIDNYFKRNILLKNKNIKREIDKIIRVIKN